MDHRVENLPLRTTEPLREIEELGRNPLVPSESPLAMPVQSMSECAERPSGRGWSDTIPILGRIAMLMIAAALTGYALYEMLAIVGFGDANWAQLLLVILFLATFSWMSLGTANAVLGFFRTWFIPQKTAVVPQPGHPGGRTAIIMPICNEDPQQTFAALSRMGDEISAMAWRRRVEFFILSDTRDPAIGMREFQLAGVLSQRLAGRIPVYYRRRSENSGRKAGNIAEFMRRWGSRYDYMIVLDADSYLTPQSIGGLIAAMDDDPKAGLIQAAIRLAGNDSLFARLQQFSAAAYGRIANAGACLWQGRDGNFNGHNAIVRVSAFASSCGLPDLPGGKPFGGHILSHDFVEAALLRRGGWDVYTRMDIDGTYEESPPNLIEYFKRDRRWMQGNLQHSRVLSAVGLHWMSRLHLAFGIMSYLSPILWMLFLLAGAAIAIYATVTPQNYFPDAHSLFPTWPIFDSERAIHLMGFVAVVVLMPKILGFIDTLLRPRARAGAGGVFPLTVSAFLEVIVAALLAPLHMIVQTVHFIEILSAQDSGWPSQDRRGSSVSLRKALKHFLLPTLIGALMAVGSFNISMSLFIWLIPIWAGLMLAIPMAMITGSRSTGLATRRAGLFLIEEEQTGQDGQLPAQPGAGAPRPVHQN